MSTTRGSIPAPRRDGSKIVLPGFATVHSQAFQRVLRGRTQRPLERGGSTSSWRELMGVVAHKLDPDLLFSIARFAYAELAMTGVTAVGEFHYLHHHMDGSPYSDRLIMADALVRAAREAGIRITLVRAICERDVGPSSLTEMQLRCADKAAEVALSDIEALASRFTGDPLVVVGVAPYSLRTVSRAGLAQMVSFAHRKCMPLHAQVAEQRVEVQHCLAEHGMRPVDLLQDVGAIDGRFVAVHGIHLTAEEILTLGQAKSFVCLCSSTERDLGDGSPDAEALANAGARLCIGVDRHVVCDAFEEARAVELVQRTRTEARQILADGSTLLDIASRQGYAAIGMEGGWRGDRTSLDARDPSIIGAPQTRVEDAVMFGATPRAIRDVDVAGRPVVRDGIHIRYDSIVVDFLKALRKLDLQ